MKRYEFRAVRSGMQEAIIGLAFAAIIMLPILAIKLGLFYSGLDKILKLNPPALLGFVFAVLAIVYAGFYFVGKMQKYLVKNYVVELNAKNIRILENGKEIMTDSVSGCKISNKIEGKPTDSVSIIIYTDMDKITFRLRGREWRMLAGNAWSNTNPFGTSDIHDMETALSLGKDIKHILEESISTDYRY